MEMDLVKRYLLLHTWQLAGDRKRNDGNGRSASPCTVPTRVGCWTEFSRIAAGPSDDDKTISNDDYPEDSSSQEPADNQRTSKMGGPWALKGTGGSVSASSPKRQ